MLEKNGEQKLFLGDEQEKYTTNKVLFEYIKKHLKISTNNRISDYSILGKETENDAIFVYIEIENIKECYLLELEFKLIQIF